ncbi:hypothetical protein FPQ18DRAFT_384144 [Pyronema domesticum]|nr:hypothetical protein FPQ18DRAFT_384144 [Pyronema domesticum]
MKFSTLAIATLITAVAAAPAAQVPTDEGVTTMQAECSTETGEGCNLTKPHLFKRSDGLSNRAAMETFACSRTAEAGLAFLVDRDKATISRINLSA